MSGLGSMIQRNIKLFFKDKALFFVAMISPAILIVLFIAFLGGIYKDTFTNALSGADALLSDGLLDGTVVLYLIASLLATSCVTVAFCCNIMSIQDKVNGVAEDFKSTPVKSFTIALSYFIATFLVSSLICLIILSLSLVILGVMGQFYFDIPSVLLAVLDTLILCLFGSLLSSIVCHFCSSQPQISAIATIMSSCYGFLCGAYMPISQFASGLRGFVSVLPGTFGTSLLKNHLLAGHLAEMQNSGVPSEAIDAMKSSLDLKLEAFGNNIDFTTMYLILIVTLAVLLVVFLYLNRRKKASR